jgi:hypothetical protein
MKQKNGGKAAWWQYFEPVLVKKEGKDWECKLKCIRGGPGACGALLTATERNWSLFGNIFTKTKNRLALERAKKLAYIRTNGSQRTLGADEEIQLSVIDVLDEEEGGEEGEAMEIA